MLLLPRLTSETDTFDNATPFNFGVLNTHCELFLVHLEITGLAGMLLEELELLGVTGGGVLTSLAVWSDIQGGGVPINLQSERGLFSIQAQTYRLRANTVGGTTWNVNTTWGRRYVGF